MVKNENVDIFEENFDPVSLTKAQLRSKLAENDVLDLPPVTCKKDELVKMLVEQVINPKKKKMAKKPVAASSNGIEFMAGSERASKNSTVSIASKDGKTESQSILDTPKGKDAKKKAGVATKKSTKDNDENPFSDENPFQSPVIDHAPSKASVRSKLIDSENSVAQKSVLSPKSKSSISVSDASLASKSAASIKSPITNGISLKSPIVENNSKSRLPVNASNIEDTPKASAKKATPKSSSIKKPASLLKSPSVIVNSESPTSSPSFARRKVSLARPPTPLPFPDKLAFDPLIRKNSVEKKDLILQIGLMFLSTVKLTMKLFFVFCAITYIYINFVNPFPYCDTGKKRPSFSFNTLDAISDSFSRFCIECPENGKCANGILKCADKYFEKRGFWFSSECVLDKRKLSGLEDLMNQAKKILNTHLGSIQAKLAIEPDTLHRQKPSLVGLTKEQLKKILTDPQNSELTSRPWNLTPEKFREYWQLFLNEFVDGDPSAYAWTGIDVVDGFFVGKDPIFPLAARIKRQILKTITEFKMQLIVLSAVALLIAIVRRLIERRRKIAQIADLIVAAIYKKLLEQEMASRNSYSMAPSLSISQLRDSMLVQVPLSSSDKIEIWKKVCVEVSANSNVRETVSIVKGEQHKVWEWIGLTDAAADSSSSNQRLGEMIEYNS